MTPVIIGVSFAFSRIFLPKKQNCTTTRCDMKKLTSFSDSGHRFPLK